MGYTKRQFIVMAFDEATLSAYVFNLTPAQLQTQLWKLDAMMDNWYGKGIVLSYPIPASPEDSDLDQETNVPSWANQAVITNLAIKIAPSFGKTVPIETKAVARDSLAVLELKFAQPREMQFPGTMPAGAGNKRWRWNGDPFLRDPVDRLDKSLPWSTKATN